MSLSYLRDDCHKQAVTHIRESRWFESMYILQEKTRPTWHTLPTLSPRMVQDHTYLTWSTYSNPFAKSSTELSSVTAPEKKDSWHNPQHVGWPIHGSIPSFSPESTNEAVGVKPSICWRRLLVLPDSYHRHAIGAFNTYSRGPTYRSLTDTGGGYNVGDVGLPHITSWLFQPAVSTFP
jgi:hypothetical protein